MEVNYGKFITGYSGLCQTGSSSYDCAQWFNGGAIPADPKGNPDYHWCWANDPANNPVCSTTTNPLGNNAPEGGARDNNNWMVCASLEAGGKFCRRSQQ